MGNLLMENRNGLIVDARLTQATGTAQRETALAMSAARAGHGRLTLGADKAFYTHGLVAALRECRVTPHIAVDIRNAWGNVVPAVSAVERLRHELAERND